MAVTLTREFGQILYYFVLFVVVCVALGLSIWAFATPCKKDKFGDFNNIGLSESPSTLQACAAAPGFYGDPIPPCDSPKASSDCGSHGKERGCSEGSLGFGEACDPNDNKCCGYNASPPFSAGKLKCIPDGISCPSCK